MKQESNEICQCFFSLKKMLVDHIKITVKNRFLNFLISLIFSKRRAKLHKEKKIHNKGLNKKKILKNMVSNFLGININSWNNVAIFITVE